MKQELQAAGHITLTVGIREKEECWPPAIFSVQATFRVGLVTSII